MTTSQNANHVRGLPYLKYLTIRGPDLRRIRIIALSPKGRRRSKLSGPRHKGRGPACARRDPGPCQPALSCCIHDLDMSYHNIGVYVYTIKLHRARSHSEAQELRRSVLTETRRCDNAKGSHRNEEDVASSGSSTAGYVGLNAYQYHMTLHLQRFTGPFISKLP